MSFDPPLGIQPQGIDFILEYRKNSEMAGYGHLLLMSDEEADDYFDPGEVRTGTVAATDNPVFVLLLLFLSCGRSCDWDEDIEEQIGKLK